MGYLDTHIHTHATTCMHIKHDNFMQMAMPMGQTLGNSYDGIICMYVSVHAHVCN